MLENTAFEQAKREMLRRYRRGSAEGLALDCSFLLDQSPLLEVVRVKKTGEDAAMLEVTCRPRTLGVAADALAAELRQIWLGDLRYPYSDVHTVTTSADEVALAFATVEGEDGPCVTGRIIVGLRPPRSKQRRPVPAPGR